MQPFGIDDVSVHPWTKNFADNYTQINLRSYAIAPFIREGRWVASIGVSSDQPRHWTASEMLLLENIVARVAPLLERARAETALRQTSDELERQLRKLDAIAASLPDFIYTFDLSGRFTYISQSLLDLWQKTLAEAMGKSFFELDYPEDLAARLQNQIQQVIETRQLLKDETPYTSAVGNQSLRVYFRADV